MAEAKIPTKFLWLDMEMTGLDPVDDKILEVAAIVTDHQLNELGSFESLIARTDSELALMKKADWFDWAGGKPTKIGTVYDMATQNGLIDRIKTEGRPENEVVARLADLIGEHFMSPAIMAGNSIRIDRLFIDTQWPEVAQKLHYRMLDVSSFKLWWTANGKPEYRKQEKHRALDDIRESIAELAFYSQDINF